MASLITPQFEQYIAQQTITKAQLFLTNLFLQISPA